MNPQIPPESAHAVAGSAAGAGISRIESLIEELESSADPAAQAQARAVVQAVLEFHGAALRQLMSHLAAAGVPGRAVLDACVRDDLVSSLLLLHDLHPHDLDTRVARALDQVRPQLRAHGGDVALLGLEGGVVRLQMQGSCHGCPSSAVTLRTLIETAVYNAAPDAAAIEVEGVVEAQNAVVPPLVTIGPVRMPG